MCSWGAYNRESFRSLGVVAHISRCHDWTSDGFDRNRISLARSCLLIIPPLLQYELHRAVYATMDKEANLSLPRILCLHGGGVNAQVFEMQARVIAAHLRNTFRLVYLDAPFAASPHPDIVQVYGDCGPFYRWLRWQPDHPAIDARSAAEEIMTHVLRRMENDEGTGEWVGVLGFSQGAKIAASLLWAQEKLGPERAKTSFKFGVIMAGSAPVVMLDWRLPCPQHVTNANTDATTFEDWPNAPEGDHVLATPTLHVFGLLDPGLRRHRILRDKYCKVGTTRTVEWDGGHRLPIKTPDVTALVTKIREVAEDADVL